MAITMTLSEDEASLMALVRKMKATPGWGEILSTMKDREITTVRISTDHRFKK